MEMVYCRMHCAFLFGCRNGDSEVFFPRIQLDGISSTCEAAKALRKQFGKLDEGPQLSVQIGNHRTPLEDVKLVSNCREIERVKIAKLRYHLYASVSVDLHEFCHNSMNSDLSQAYSNKKDWHVLILCMMYIIETGPTSMASQHVSAQV